MVFVVILLAACAPEDALDTFLDRHWETPIAPQGAPPADWPAGEASLDASQCGLCHAEQYRNWQHSRHAQAMNAGILWQLEVMNQAAAQECLACHAPLAEQMGLVAMDRQWAAKPSGAIPAYVPEDLHLQGITCAVCHVRGHSRHGPPPRNPNPPEAARPPHAGAIANTAFRDSRFCSVCHQFPEDGPRLNGKLRQDTYNEWRTSRWAVAGVQCQDCHMPDRRHEWRGVSAPEMINRALTVDFDLIRNGDRHVRALARIRNTGAGHRFPTYLVPRVDIRLGIENAEGERTDLAEYALQWRASTDLTEEIFDQRLAVDETTDVEVLVAQPEEDGWRVWLAIDVAPKEHYERVYRRMLKQADELPPSALVLLRQALEEAEASRFRALDRSLPIPTTFTK